MVYQIGVRIGRSLFGNKTRSALTGAGAGWFTNEAGDVVNGGSGSDDNGLPIISQIADDLEVMMTIGLVITVVFAILQVSDGD